MQEHSYSNNYPIKIVCRRAALARLRKLRLSWFVAGVAFSIGCTSALTPIFDRSSTIASNGESGYKISDYAARNRLLEEIVGAGPTDIAGIAQEETIPVELVDINNKPIPEKTLEQPKVVELESNPAKALDKTLENIVTAGISTDKSAIEQENNKIVSNTATKDAKEAEKNENAPQIAYPQTFELKVQKSGSLVSLITGAGIPKDEAQNTLNAIKTIFNPRRIDAGSVVTVKADKDKKGNVIISKIKLPISKISTIELTRTKDDEFSVKQVRAPLVKKLARVGTTINGSIYQAGANAGIPSSMLSELINAYSYDVDFQRDVRKGSSIDVLYERLETKDGVVAANGNFVYAELKIGKEVLKVYRYVDKSGVADFYNEKGESVRKALLRTPINSARVTSSFGMREHPIHGYNKMHRGVDFGAPIGTPVYASGDGVVESSSVKSGYGNYLKIKHNDKYSSAYAHLSRFASGIFPGKNVKQGQIVGYVGMTGATTGPHLHYEILVNDEQVNPANVKFKTGNILRGKELAMFRGNMNKLEAKLSSLSRSKAVATAITSNDKKSLNN